jgi:hypothetical protein
MFAAPDRMPPGDSTAIETPPRCLVGHERILPAAVPVGPHPQLTNINGTGY